MQYKLTSLDPIKAIDSNTQFIVNNAFDGLISWSRTRGIRPQIAKKWTFSNHGKTVTFHIRENLFFHDGTPLSAIDVKKHFDRIRSPSSYYRSHYDNIKAVVAVDNTIQFHLKERDSKFLFLLSGAAARIVKLFGNSVIGSGPFTPEIQNDRVVLRAFDNYWQGPPPTQEIVFDILPEKQAIRKANNLEVDDLFAIALQGSEIKSGEDSWLVQPMWTTWIIGFDQRVEPLNKSVVRKEFTNRLDSSSFVEQIFPNQLPAKGIIPFGLPGFIAMDKEKNFWKFNAKKRELVEIHIPDLLAEKEKISSWISEKMKGSFIDVKLIFTPFDKMMEKYANGKMGAFIVGINAEYPDVSFIVRALSSDSTSNFLGIKDESLDLLIRDAISEENRPHRQNIYKRINQTLINQAATVNLMHVKNFIWKRKCVTGFEANPVSEGYFNIRGLINKCP